MTEPTPDGKADQSTRTSRRWVLAMTAVAAALAVAVAVLIVVVLRSENGDDRAVPTPPASSTATPSTSTTPTGSATPSATPTEPTPTPASGFGYQPLWPFAGVEEAAVWQRAYRDGGHQPWHLDAGLVARRFTQGYLGYQEVDRVLRMTISDDQA